MSDEEDTTNLLRSEQPSTENEIRSNRTTNSHQYVNVNKVCTIQSTVGLVAIFTSGLSFGYDLSIISNVIQPISFTWDLDCNEQSYAISVWWLGAVASSIIGGVFIDFCGRKWSVIFSTLMLAFSSIMLCTLNSFRDLLISRLVSGFCGPLLLVSEVIYISETSNHNVRGFRVTLHFVGASLGCLLAYLVGLNIPVDDYTWRLAQAFTVVPVILTLMITLIWLPKSPHFVLYQTAQGSIKKTNLKTTILIETVIISLLLIIFKQLLGRYTVFYYAPRLFSMLGICTLQTSIAVVTTSIVKFLSTCLCLHIVDQLGRRVTLILSSIIMMISIALLAIISMVNVTEQSFTLFEKENCNRIILTDMDGVVVIQKNDKWNSLNFNVTQSLNEDPPPFPMLPTPLSLVNNVESCLNMDINMIMKISTIFGVILLFLYEAAFTFGFGVLTWIVITELFPTSIRGRGICNLNLLHWLMDFYIPTNFMQIDSNFGPAFLTYSFIAMLSIFVVYLLVPETRTKSLHQVAQEIHNVSILTRTFQNLYTLPFFNNSQWIEHRTRQYRHQNRSTERTVI